MSLSVAVVARLWFKVEVLGPGFYVLFFTFCCCLPGRDGGWRLGQSSVVWCYGIEVERWWEAGFRPRRRTLSSQVPIMAWP